MLTAGVGGGWYTTTGNVVETADPQACTDFWDCLVKNWQWPTVAQPSAGTYQLLWPSTGTSPTPIGPSVNPQQLIKPLVDTGKWLIIGLAALAIIVIAGPSLLGRTLSAASH